MIGLADSLPFDLQITVLRFLSYPEHEEYLDLFLSVHQKEVQRQWLQGRITRIDHRFGRFHLVDGRLHSLDDQPAFEGPFPTKRGKRRSPTFRIWCANGRLHRPEEKGPALVRQRYQMWYHHGQLHRIGGPATQWSNGKEEWFFEDRLHRPEEEGPALIDPKAGIRCWYVHGRKHRIGGPAVEHFAVTPEGKETIFLREWFFEGLLHREDGPAVVDPFGQNWYRKGEHHRLDGPAVEGRYRHVWYQENNCHRSDGPAVEWFSFLENERYRREWHLDNLIVGVEFPNGQRFGLCFETPLSDGEYQVDFDALRDDDFLFSCSIHVVDGHLHREGAPAVVYRSQELGWEFRSKGQFHRLDGPAMVTSLQQRWYYRGELHRPEGDKTFQQLIRPGEPEWYSPAPQEPNGPAILWSHGQREWWKHSQRHRVNGPANQNGDEEEWYFEGRPHRTDGPAIVASTLIEYRIHGRLHREGGPARLRQESFRNFSAEWFLHGEPHREKGPAFQQADLLKWMENGMVHRGDGNPAMIRRDGRALWFIFDRKIGDAQLTAEELKAYFSPSPRSPRPT